MQGKNTRSLTIETQAVRYAREYSKAFVVANSDWPSVVSEWIWPALEELSKTSVLRPIHTTKWEHIRWGLKYLSRLPSWKELVSSPEESEIHEIVVRVFGQLEKKLVVDHSPRQAYYISMYTRGLIRNRLISLNPKGRVARSDVMFRSQIKFPRANGRGLISDITRRDTNGELLYPVGATPHTSAADLQRKVATRLEADLLSIEECCAKVLAHYDTCLDRLSQIREATLSIEDEENLRRFLSEVPDCNSFDENQMDELISFYAKIDCQERMPLKGATKYVHATRLKDRLCDRLGITPLVFLSALRLDAYPPSDVRVACMLILQMRTKWNIGSVLELRSDLIENTQNSYWVQSYKSKTDDQTPPVLIDHSDHLGCKAIQILTSSLKTLKDRGWINADETRLWISSKKEKNTGQPIQVSNVSHMLQSFQSRFSIPRFSFEQVRDQALTIVALGTAGPYAASEAAGHASIATIGGYLQDIITDRLHQANNLEFQTRWAAAVKYELAPKTVKPGTRMVPIGDGASCVNPEQPPDEEWLQHGMCNGQNCHGNDGCTNLRIVIDAERVEEVQLTTQFYENNWQRLFNQNSENFTRFHLPSMTFNLVLRAILKNGPYRHLLK